MKSLINQPFFSQFKNVKTISTIIFLSIFSSLFSLVIPVTVQILVNYMIFGRMIYPIVFLSILLFFIFFAYGIVNIFQELIIEVFQQQMFLNFSLDFSKKINHFRMSFFLNYNSSELINKFFEITNIQKAFTAILIYGTALVFQMLVGLALLASYHPSFIIYDVLLILGLYIPIKAFLKPAVTSSVQLCQKKHHVASWLESIQKNFEIFNKLINVNLSF
jgi:ABC-type bacteriocin/lantibiotic exporter with double-glycine peptidase domain